MKTRVLHHLQTRLSLWLALRALMLLAGVLGLASLTGVLLDAAIDLPDSARLAAPWVLLFCAALVIALGFLYWHRSDEQRVARTFERFQPSLGNRLLNAVQLSSRSGKSPVQEFLRQEAVELGRKAAAGLRAWHLARAGVLMAFGIVCTSALFWFCLTLISPDILQAVAPRFLDPKGDHPPYSKLRLEVSPGPAQILYGGQLEVRANARGRPTDKLWLVLKAGTNSTRAIMFLAPDKSFFQSLANLREAAEYFVTDGQARSCRFPISVRYTPQITMVELTTEFPQYTGKSARTAKLPDEPQALPEDTRLTFRVASNRPLKSGSITLTPVLGGKVVQIPLEPQTQNNIVSGSFTLTEPGVFSLSIRDVDNLDCTDPRQGRFNILPDERPRLFVLEPGRDAVATPAISVPVRVQAQDDYGISRVVWLRGLNRSIERPFSMKLALKNGAQSVEAVSAFDFAKLGVRPGDIIDYYFEAADNFPKGPNITLSRLYRVQIISTEQYAAILRQVAARKALFEPYFKLDAWLRRLAERARNLDKQAQSGSDAEKAAAAKEAAALADDLAKYESELGKLLPQAVMFDVEQSFRETLVEQHSRIAAAHKKMQAALGSGQFDPKQFSEASQQLAELAQTEQQNVGGPASEIAAVARLLARADTFVKLAQEQATLARMLRRFADRSGELSRVEQMEMQELAYQQRRIQEGLHALLGALPDMLAQLPEDPKYDPLRHDVNEFLKAVTDAKIEEDLTQNSKLLADLDAKRGAPLAQTAAEKMDMLIAKCSSELGQQAAMCLRFQPKVQQKLGQTLEQILAAMGANQGNGQGGRDGYSMFNDDVALYGPNMELAGEQAGGRMDNSRAASGRSERVPGAAPENESLAAKTSALVRLQPDAKFPLRYRDLVGEYFRVIAESEADQQEKK